MINREIYSTLVGQMFRGKAIVLIGARQVGKTTLLRQLAKEADYKVLYLNCDEPQTISMLTNRNLRDLQMVAGDNKVIIIDEAQKVDNIGLTLKLMVDNMPDRQVIATGSSAFELHNRLNEPLTGRKYEYRMYPISTNEIYHSFGYQDIPRMLETRLIYGSYPDILTHPAEALELLTSLADSYLYKDILSLERLRKPEALNKLVQSLALQIGSEVSYNELSGMTGLDTKTVERYIDLLEKCFIVFRLNGLSRNVLNELKKSKKIYFYDNGVRNAVIQNFSPIDLRNDIGALWENFFISERIKHNSNRLYHCNFYFWRTATQQEIDYIEERDGQFTAFEMKWNPKRGTTKFPQKFLDAYDVKESIIITPDNYIQYVID